MSASRQRGRWASIVVTTISTIGLLLGAAPAVDAAVAAPALAEVGPPTAPEPFDLPATPIVAGAPVGYLPGSGAVTATGAYHYTIPIDVPAGRAGMQPDLALEYSGGTSDGLLGVGWSLSGSGSTIVRCGQSLSTEGTVTGITFTKDNDKFCLDGKKLMAVGGVDYGTGGYGEIDTQYRTEDDEFAQVISSGSGATIDSGPDFFLVRTKSGEVLRYEPQSSTRRRDSVSVDGYQRSTTSTVRSVWVLKSRADRSGNEVRYAYASAGGENEYIPTEITYTHGPGMAAARKVVFEYQGRDLSGTLAYQAGVKSPRTLRLFGLSMYAPNPGTPQLVWRYLFGYATSHLDDSLLTSITKCGPSGACLKAKQFGYDDPAAAPSFTPRTVGPLVLFGAGSRKPWMHVLDVDGDGSTDLLYEPGGWTDSDSPKTLRMGQRDAAGTVNPLADLSYLTGIGYGFPAEVALRNSRPLDLESDGKAEFMAQFTANSTLHDRIEWWDPSWASYQSTGIDFTPKTNGASNFGDLNGDGLLDYLTTGVVDPATGFGRVSFRINQGGWYGPQLDSTFTACASRTPVVSDVDGDGRAELVLSQQVGASCSGLYALRLTNDGTAIAAPQSLSEWDGVRTYWLARTGGAGEDVVRGDFNGDGLVDDLIVPLTATSPATLLWNTGNGLAIAGHSPVVARDNGVPTIQVADLNRDGRDDLVSFYSKTTAYLSHGDGTFTAADLAADGGTSVPGAGRSTSRLGDFNGDGRIDVVRVVNNAIVLLEQDSSRFPTMLTTVSDEGVGWARETIGYGNYWTDHPELHPQPCSYPMVCRRAGMTVVRSVASRAHNADVGSVAAATARTFFYSYEDPVTDLRGRGFLGFGVQRVWDPSQPAETITEFGNRTRVDGKYYPLAGTPVKVTVAVPIVAAPKTGTTTETARVTRTVRAYETMRLNNNLTYAVVDDTSHTTTWEEPVTVTWGAVAGTSRTDHVSDVQSSPPTVLRTVDTQSDSNAFGDTTFASVTTTGGIARSVTSLFDHRIDEWLVGLRKRDTTVATEADGSTATRVVDYTIDDVGRLSTVEVEKSGGPDVRETTGYGYDSRGVLRTVTRTAGNPAAPSLPVRIDHLEYDAVFPGQPAEEVYPSQSWSEHTPTANRPSTWLATHPAYGVPVASLDANGVQTVATYDEFGRPVTTKSDGSAVTTYSYAGRPDAGGPNGVIVTTTGAGITGTAHTDVLGRSLKTTVTGFTGTAAVAGKTAYDLLGRVASRTAAAPGGTTTFAYDSLDRPTATTLADGHVQGYQYPSFSTSKRIDPSGNETTTTSDVDGRVVSSSQRLSPTTSATTTYAYAPFDLLRRVTDAQGNVTSMEYDVRGRRTKLTEPDRGVTTTSWYGTGQVRTDTHAGTGHSTTFGYDDLGRMTSSSSEDGTSTFGYDTAVHGIGALAYTVSPDAVRVDYRYDTAGRRIGEDYTDQSTNTTYQTDKGFDSSGRLSTVTYPDPDGTGPAARFALTYAYNVAGRLAFALSTTQGQTTKTLLTVTGRQPNLALDTATLGNGVGLDRDYDSPTGRLHRQQATATGGTKLQDVVYGYGVDGLVASRTQDDSTAHRTETFGYDSLRRLSSWTLANGTASPVTRTYGYDTGGNFYPLNVGDDRSYGAPGGTPHALVTRDGPDGLVTYTYDGQGRQTSTVDEAGTPLREVTYTSFDLPKTVTKDGAVTTFRYDAFGRRFAEASRFGVTISVGGLYEKRTVEGLSRHVYHVSGPDGPIGQVVFTGTAYDVQYQLTDSLGSVSTVAGATGAATGSFFYDPFGARINADGTRFTGTTGDTTAGFTGHEHDDELGLVNMRGRVYDPGQQRFLTPDPVVGDASATQSWNPYGYVNYSPLNYTDPSGYVMCIGPGGLHECGEGGGGGGYDPCGCGWDDPRLAPHGGSVNGDGGAGPGAGGGGGDGGTAPSGGSGGGNGLIPGPDASYHDIQTAFDIVDWIRDSQAYAAGGIKAVYGRCHVCADAERIDRFRAKDKREAAKAAQAAQPAAKSDADGYSESQPRPSRDEQMKEITDALEENIVDRVEVEGIRDELQRMYDAADEESIFADYLSQALSEVDATLEILSVRRDSLLEDYNILVYGSSLCGTYATTPCDRGSDNLQKEIGIILWNGGAK